MTDVLGIQLSTEQKEIAFKLQQPPITEAT